MTGRSLKWLACAVGALFASAAPTSEHFVLIGGGPVPTDSQVSIEKNVIWIDGMMRDRAFTSHTLLFASGPTGRPDVVLHSPGDPDVQRWLPLARLYGEQKAAMSIFRRNEVPGVDAVASEASTTATLQRRLADMRPGDGLFLVYNGHGSWQSRDTSQSALRLWGESRLNVREFAALLDSRPAGTMIRAVFPQCFAGGFARSLFNDVINPSIEAVREDFCGFFSVADNVEAEGCTPGVDVGEYRDYSTFFFAALTDRTRLGEPLKSRPDLDGDGRVSLSEAHVYAYVEGLSTDVPRATSEHYLEVWQPWFARWQSTPRPAADNPYMKIALRLADKLGIARQDITALAAVAIAERRVLEAEITTTDDELAAVTAEEATLRKRLLADLQREWPATAKPHTAAYLDLITQRPDEMLAWIIAQTEYSRLADLQTRMEQIELHRLEQRRNAASFARLHRMLKLGVIKENFDRLASDRERAQFDSLTQCESWTPPQDAGLRQ